MRSIAKLWTQCCLIYQWGVLSCDPAFQIFCMWKCHYKHFLFCLITESMTHDFPTPGGAYTAFISLSCVLHSQPIQSLFRLMAAIIISKEHNTAYHYVIFYMLPQRPPTYAHPFSSAQRAWTRLLIPSSAYQSKFHTHTNQRLQMYEFKCIIFLIT